MEIHLTTARVPASVEMSPRDRVLAALDGEESDRVPMFEFEVQIGDKLVGTPRTSNGRTLAQPDAERSFRFKVRLWRKLGYDMISVPLQMLPLAQKIAPELAYLGGCGRVSPMPAGMQDVETIRRFYFEPSWVREKCAEMTKRAIEEAKIQVEAGFEIIRGGLDDMAGKEGPFLAPRFYHRFIFPNLAKLVRAVHRMGAKLLVHSDGDLRPILDGLVSSGIDALHSIDPSSGMDIRDVKERYGSRLCILGNVDCAWTLTYGKPGDVAAETRRCLNVAAPGGGYILSSSNVIHAYVPVENALAMVKTGKRYGKYDNG